MLQKFRAENGATDIFAYFTAATYRSFFLFLFNVFLLVVHILASLRLTIDPKVSVERGRKIDQLRLNLGFDYKMQSARDVAKLTFDFAWDGLEYAAVNGLKCSIADIGKQEMLPWKSSQMLQHTKAIDRIHAPPIPFFHVASIFPPRTLFIPRARATR